MASPRFDVAAATNVPRPGSRRIKPSASSSSSAWRTVIRLTPYVRPSPDSDCSGAPGGSSPLTIRRWTMFFSCTYRGTKLRRSIFTGLSSRGRRRQGTASSPRSSWRIPSPTSIRSEYRNQAFPVITARQVRGIPLGIVLVNRVFAMVQHAESPKQAALGRVGTSLSDRRAAPRAPHVLDAGMPGCYNSIAFEPCPETKIKRGRPHVLEGSCRQPLRLGFTRRGARPDPRLSRSRDPDQLDLSRRPDARREASPHRFLLSPQSPTQGLLDRGLARLLDPSSRIVRAESDQAAAKRQRRAARPRLAPGADRRLAPAWHD